MTVTFGRNHNGQPLVLVDGKVVNLVKDCDGFEYVALHVLSFPSIYTLKENK